MSHKSRQSRAESNENQTFDLTETPQSISFNHKLKIGSSTKNLPVAAMRTTQKLLSFIDSEHSDDHF